MGSRWKACAPAMGVAFVMLVFAGLGNPGRADPCAAISNYHEESAYLPQSPSVSGGAVGAFGNPASWATGRWGEAAFWWDDRSDSRSGLDNWGFSFGHDLGLAVSRQSIQGIDRTFRVTDYQFGFSGGGRHRFGGVAWRWSNRDGREIGRERAIAAGFIGRPTRRISWGVAGTFSADSPARQGVFDMGLRPFGSQLLTIYGDFALRNGETLADGRWGAGFEIRPVAGLHLGMKFREAEGEDDYRYNIQIGLTLDDSGLHALPAYDQDGELGTTTFLWRMRPPYPGLPLQRTVQRLLPIGPTAYAQVDLENRILTYQRPRWFERRREAWIDLARRLDAVRDDPRTRGVALNLAGLQVRASIAWEFRKKLEELREAGKEIVIQTDRLDFRTYWLASVADRLSIDPVGLIDLHGLAAHRTYMRGLLDKVGIGFEEWRYFTHKSAMEAFSHRQMSEADREQIGRLVDVIYETFREDICRSRGMTPEGFDTIVDDDVLLMARLGLERRLVDALDRWDHLEDWLREERKGARLVGLPELPDAEVFADETWGGPPEVAIVYALGPCEMDSGIRGRETSEHLRKLSKNRDVAAVVLRADSPGGDPLPSDLVADGTRTLKQKGKPVVVSQGDVAGSGGYWISMDGSKILTTPVTVTGSIGAIAGWFWDDGFGEKTGFSADGVQRGKHADLFTGIRYPFIDMRLPERNLTGEERALVKERIMDLYGDFVAMVAEGRGLTEARVRELGEGRIWMGGDAIENGLCDRFGTLQDAIAEAKRLAGLEPDERVLLTEFPPRPLFQPPVFGPSLPGLGIAASWLASRLAPEAALPEETESYEIQYLKALAGAAGNPMLLVPPEALPDGVYMRDSDFRGK